MLRWVMSAVDPADALDITLVAVLVYGLLIWFKRARAAFVAKGMLVVAAVYLVARTTGMVMMTNLFHAFFATVVVALVVIFQEEIRSVFERIAVFSLSRGPAPEPAERQADMIVRAIFDMAAKRTGALLVLCGRDPLDRHVQAGWNLGGELSEPLLKSIFDAHSEGHDGAVIIDGARVTRFGALLPLPSAPAKGPGLGTRHSAAQALTELTDALSIVVSEERGAVSVAEAGQLEATSTPEALRARLERFWADRRPEPVQDAFSKFFRRHKAEKAIAATSAVLLWAVLVLGGKEWRQSYDVPVLVKNQPAHHSVARVTPPAVRVTLAGYVRDFLWLDPQRLAVRIDGSRMPPGTSALGLAPEHAVRPPRLNVEEIAPDVVQVELSTH